MTDDQYNKIRTILMEHNLPLDNPVLIVEVLVAASTSNDDGDLK